MTRIELAAAGWMEFDQLFNLCEGLLWVGIAILLLAKVRHAVADQDLLWIAGLAFFIFGVSDFIEIFTRAWYRPVSLLLLKVVCIVTLGTCRVLYLRRKK